MRVVGFSIAAITVVCLTGCAGNVAGSRPSPVGAPGAGSGMTGKVVGTAPGAPGKEGVPQLKQGAADTRATVKGGVTVHPVAGTKATRLPGLSGANRAPAASADQQATSAKGPLVKSPLPRLATAKGRLAAGHPAVLGAVGGSTVTVSSVTPAGGELQVGLSARGGGSASAVLAAFRARLVPLGFSETAAHGVAGATAVRFTRGHDVVTVSAKTASKQTTYTVFGVLHTTG